MPSAPVTELAGTLRVLIPGVPAYDVHVGPGLVTRLGACLQGLAAGKPLRPYIVTSPEIWRLWSEPVLASFPQDRQPPVFFLPAGEPHKRLAELDRLAEELARAGADRDALLVAFGGGVVGDMTGFLAAIYMRGVAYVQVPTTLLAQVDSSVGGKTGANLQAGKNLVGAFHHPRAVFADIDVLRTLPPAQLRSGLQESVKAAIIADPGLFDYLEANRAAVLAGDPAALAHVVRMSVRIKAEVVAGDEREAGRRMILNFGHTLGHAIEAATGYAALLHGEAVAWGSVAALHLARSRGALLPADFTRMHALIHSYGPLPPFTADAVQLVALTATDKKARSGRRAFVLPRAIGSVEVVHDVDDKELQAAAEAMLAEVVRA